jgi:predicted transcriptional regulator
MKRLNHKEEEIMTILWRLGQAFVNDIIAEMEPPAPPYNTVSSIVRKLQDNGLIGFEAFGKTHRYYPILKKEEYRVGAFRRFMDNYFSGSPTDMLSFFMKEEKMDPAELDALLKKIKDQE